MTMRLKHLLKKNGKGNFTIARIDNYGTKKTYYRALSRGRNARDAYRNVFIIPESAEMKMKKKRQTFFKNKVARGL